MTAAPTVLGWDTFVQQSMALEVAGRDTPADAPFEVLDALPQAELPRMPDVPHDVMMTAVLMPDALDGPTLMALWGAPVPDGDARDMVYACLTSQDEFGHDVVELALVGMGSLKQRRDASGNVCVRLHWRGQEWPVLLVERDGGTAHAMRALSDSLDALPDGKGKPLADALRAHTTMALRHADMHPGVLPELMTMAYAVLMRARLGMNAGMRSPAHQALTRRMWARCIATVQARAEAEVADRAVEMPSVTAQLVPTFVLGRKESEVKRRMRSALDIDIGRRVATADGKARPSLVTVTPHWPDGISRARCGKVVVSMEPSLWPTFGPKDDAQAMMMDVLVQYLPAPNLMRMIAYVALIHERGGVELDGDELPTSLRKDVMELTGYPSHRASALQREAYRNVGHAVRHWEWKVEPYSTGGGKGKGRPKRRPERVPLLLASALEMDSNRAVRMVANPEVIAGGRTTPVPRALFSITDDMDLDGAMRMLGVGIVSRLVLSAARHQAVLGDGESLEKVLTRLGLIDKLRDRHRERGAASAQAWLDGLLDGLRSIGPANIIGDTHVEWGKGGNWLAGATLNYGAEQPGWLARKRPAALPPASSPSAVISA
jgi:hypothetical protein